MSSRHNSPDSVHSIWILPDTIACEGIPSYGWMEKKRSVWHLTEGFYIAIYSVKTSQQLISLNAD